jgi:acetolactate synthase small subunit
MVKVAYTSGGAAAVAEARPSYDEIVRQLRSRDRARRVPRSATTLRRTGADPLTFPPAPASPCAPQLGSQPHKAAVRDLGQLFGAEVVDVGTRHIVFQLTSWSRRIDAFIRMLEPFGIIEVARSGVVAMLRSPVAGSLADKLRTPSAAKMDDSQLPPG